MKLVLKFGGTSLSSVKDIQNVAKTVGDLSNDNKIVVVCSAVDGTTDELIQISEYIKKENKKDANRILARISQKHKQFTTHLVTDPKIQKSLLNKMKSDLSELEELVHGLLLLGEVTPRSFDYLISFGEKLSINLVSFSLQQITKKSIPLSGKQAGIVTDSNFGESRPLMDTTRIRLSKTIQDLFNKKTIPVVGGFAGADQHGNTTTFGRGGSDYTATIIASCIDADEIWLMSDVDGLMTADPKLVKDAKLLKEVSYAEAIEMAQFGAKQIHPRTFEPIVSKKIPMRIRNTFDLKNLGTVVTASPSTKTKKTVKCTSAIRNIGLIDLTGGILFAAPGTAAKIFTLLADINVNVMMVSSNPSESSISIIVKKSDLDRAVNALEMSLLGKTIKKINTTPNVSIIAVIGSGMSGTVGVASKVFSAVQRRNVNVIMIAQGSSELNLAFVVKDNDCKSVIQALHEEFNLANIN
ncbi:MAG TPA: aspartate kinase [Candidatus Nitrosopelagicus sp.]|nr:aspartate kinase [Candidatus Nitrosopelagicus sp.]